VGSHAVRAGETEKALKGIQPTTELLEAACARAAAGVVALDDIHASADYRLDLARVFTRRAVLAAIERAK
jgi:carbon-monoxide dehydrogenase medium subunit